MQTYLVGGAVRDGLLGRKISEKDWVVVGATPQAMLDSGFQQVGSDFPVFLHPDTKEEYALARIERKEGHGYLGFACDASKDVTLEDDLMRRDLTVNAMAQDLDGNIIDPYGGLQDLENRVLRHVSDAFVEDPLRVLRVARFAARYAPLGFTVAEETLALMRQIQANGELEHLTAERVWKEMSRALMEPQPQVFFEVLRAANCMHPWFAEIDALWGVPNPPKWHPEVDSGIHTMMVIEQAVRLSDKLPVRYAALVHDLGKALTDPEKWPSHHGHEKLGLAPINDICARLKVPNDCKELALLVCEFHSHVHRADQLRPSTVLDVFNRCDAWRRPERFEDMLLTCKADGRGRTGFEDIPYRQADYLLDALAACQQVDVQSIIADGHKGKAIKEQLDKKRIQVINDVLQQFTF